MSGPATVDARYLRHVHAAVKATPAAVRVMGELLELPQVHRRLALLLLATDDPGAVSDAITRAAVILAGECGDCPHSAHPGDECLVAYTDVEGLDTACGCGAVSLRVARDVMRETTAEALAADARVEYSGDQLRDDQADREAHHHG